MAENRLYESSIKFIKSVCVSYINDVGVVEKRVVEKQPYRYCILSCYSQFVKNDNLVPIEKVDDQTKNDLIAKSYEWMPYGENESEEVISLSWNGKRAAIVKCLWVINFALEKYFVKND